jgi:hypothetical protein
LGFTRSLSTNLKKQKQFPYNSSSYSLFFFFGFKSTNFYSYYEMSFFLCVSFLYATVICVNSGNISLPFFYIFLNLIFLFQNFFVIYTPTPPDSSLSLLISPPLPNLKKNKLNKSNQIPQSTFFRFFQLHFYIVPALFLCSTIIVFRLYPLHTHTHKMKN